MSLEESTASDIIVRITVDVTGAIGCSSNGDGSASAMLKFEAEVDKDAWYSVLLCVRFRHQSRVVVSGSLI